MQFGKKKKDAPERGSGNYLRRFQKGETKVRFLDEQDEWTEYWEHFTPDRKSFPCTEDKESCPGCTSTNESIAKASRKYATQVLLVKQNQVLPFIVPVTLADRLSVRAEKNGGTIVNRDYAILRSGDGFDTEYDVDQEDKYPVDLGELRKKISIDIQECFNESFNAVWGGDKPATEKPAAKPAKEHTPGDADPPTEPAAEAAAASGDEETLTEAAVRAMEKPDLRVLCEKAELAWDDDDTKSELIEKLLAYAGE